MASLGTVMRVVTAGALLLAAAPARAQDDDSPVARGRRLFETHGCYGCSTCRRSGWPSPSWRR